MTLDELKAKQRKASAKLHTDNLHGCYVCTTDDLARIERMIKNGEPLPKVLEFVQKAIEKDNLRWDDCMKDESALSRQQAKERKAYREKLARKFSK